MSPIEVLIAAAASTVGVVVTAPSADKAKQALYRARREAQARGDDTFDGLMFRTAPVNPETDIWIIHKELMK